MLHPAYCFFKKKIKKNTGMKTRMSAKRRNQDGHHPTDAEPDGKASGLPNGAPHIPIEYPATAHPPSL